MSTPTELTVHNYYSYKLPDEPIELSTEEMINNIQHNIRILKKQIHVIKLYKYMVRLRFQRTGQMRYLCEYNNLQLAIDMNNRCLSDIQKLYAEFLFNLMETRKINEIDHLWEDMCNLKIDCPSAMVFS